MCAIPKHPEAHLWPSEVVTLGLLHALKGARQPALLSLVDTRLSAVVSSAPQRTRLFRLLKTHQDWTQISFRRPDGARRHRHVWDRVDPSHARRPESPTDWPQGAPEPPLDCRRETLSPAQSMGIDRGVGVCHRQWRGADNTFQWLIRQYEEQMIVLSDTAFHAVEGDPTNLKLCPRGAWEDRMLVETVLSMLTLVCHLKKVMHRGWAYFQAGAWPSLWPPSMCWSSGTVCNPTRRALCPSRSLNLVCKALK